MLGRGSDGMNKMISCKIIKTRKEHLCDECKTIILAGTEGVFSVTLANDKIYTLYVCEKCMKECQTNEADAEKQNGEEVMG
jgi:RNase P subunit RPR2